MTKQKFICNICYNNIGMHICKDCGDSICDKCIVVDEETDNICCKCNELPLHQIKIKQ